jgi:hypothetical protein
MHTQPLSSTMHPLSLLSFITVEGKATPVVANTKVDRRSYQKITLSLLKLKPEPLSHYTPDKLLICLQTIPLFLLPESAS